MEHLLLVTLHNYLFTFTDTRGRHNLKSAKAYRQKKRNEKREKKKTLKQCNSKTVKSDTAMEKSSNPFTLYTTCSSLDKKISFRCQYMEL